MEDDGINIGVKLPKVFATKVQFIGAKRDSGKSYAASVQEEQCLEKGIPIVVIDGMHAHYGLRQKYAIPVLGPVDKSAKDFQPDIDIGVEDAYKVAQMIVDFDQSSILDIANWDNETQCQFVEKFLLAIYELNNSPRHIFIEEADVFAPQSKITESSRASKSAMTQIVRRGRGRGIGVTMITQRVQVLDKDIVTQADLYLFGNFTDYHDLNVIKEYLKSFGIEKQDVIETLKKINKFKQGQFLLFSPSWLKMVKEFQIKKKHTYHAGKTPEFNEPYKFKPLPMNIKPYTSYINRVELAVAEMKNNAPNTKDYTGYLALIGGTIGVLVALVIF